MKFKDNFSEAHLLFGQPVAFSVYEEESLFPKYNFELRLPTFKDIMFNDNFKRFASLINTPIQELQKQFASYAKFSTLHGLFQSMIILNSPLLNKYLDVVIQGFKILNIDLSVSAVNFVVNDTFVLEEPLFERICRIVLIALALKKQSDFIDDPELKAMQEKIDRIKNKNNAVRNDKASIQDLYLILTYEFNYTPEQILNMTQYAINFITSYTSKSINYKLTLIGAANGNTKKVKFITNKGK